MANFVPTAKLKFWCAIDHRFDRNVYYAFLKTRTAHRIEMAAPPQIGVP